MPSLPSGTVTFLFTDIEGSTALLQRLGDRRYAEVLAEHQRLLRDAFDRGNGQEIDTQGDAFLVAFPRARDAVDAAVAAQQSLMKHTWPDGSSLRVRMGMHTGEPVSGTGGYVGLDVHRASRICSVGHGGQILLSDAVAILAARDLPPGVSLRDLGTHRLKDLKEPEHLLQVVHPDLPADFPPLKSLDVWSHNLPIQLTSFIGREREILEVKRLLGAARLVTVTGSGGAGKTRLALQVAAELLEQYPDGVWVVELAALSDHALVPNAVVSTLNISEQRGRPLTETLIEYVRPKALLFIVDNCEHLLVACAELTGSLLRSCPNLRLLATSREPLGIPGEIIWQIPSLSVPDSRSKPSLDDLTQYEAVRLFAERAATSAPAFGISADNVRAVVQVCQRLDGIPLAIELAAARVKVLTVEQIANRLDDRFRLLTGSARSVLPRQQTLLATMDWSHDLLSDKERALLRRLSVFAGGCTLEAVEGVCSGNGIAAGDVLNVLAQLVDKSLVVAETRGGEARYRLLETVRQYARDRLAESHEMTEVQNRHLDWYRALAEHAEPKLRGPEQKAWLERLEVEHDNIRAALDWSGKESGSAEAGLRLAGSLSWFWFMHGHAQEGRQRLERALSAGAGGSAPARAKALAGTGIIARRQGEYQRAQAALEESLVLSQEMGDHWGIGFSLHHLGHVADEAISYDQAKARFHESLAAFRAAGDNWGVAASLNCLGEAMQHRGDNAEATPLLKESLTLCREIGDKWLSAYPVRILGIIAAYGGHYEAATALLEESLAIERETGDKFGMAQSQSTLGNIASHQGNFERATSLLKESIILRKELGSKLGLAECLERLGAVAGGQRRPDRAVRLFGAAEALRQSIGSPLPDADRGDYDRNVNAARAVLGEDAFAAGWAAGRAMTLEQAIESALAGEAN
jgi:predicted ATPase/class 3 adenylate cyclase